MPRFRSARVLILHERDQRRDDERDARGEQRRQLVAERLARAGRHHREHVAAGQDRLDGLALPRPELGEAEQLPQIGGDVDRRPCPRPQCRRPPDSSVRRRPKVTASGSTIACSRPARSGRRAAATGRRPRRRSPTTAAAEVGQADRVDDRRDVGAGALGIVHLGRRERRREHDAGHRRARSRSRPGASAGCSTSTGPRGPPRRRPAPPRTAPGWRCPSRAPRTCRPIIGTDGAAGGERHHQGRRRTSSPSRAGSGSAAALRARGSSTRPSSPACTEQGDADPDRISRAVDAVPKPTWSCSGR